MDCHFIKTERTHRNGKPYWYCSRKGCSKKCVSVEGTCKSKCEHPTISVPLGNIVEQAIKLVTLGMMKPNADCGCKKRKRKLNAAGVIPLPNFLIKAKYGKETTETTATNRNGEHDPQGA